MRTEPYQLAWLFVDMNNFFASVEQHLRPELRGRPVGVIPVVSEGTCVIAASREAKVRGVKTGTDVWEARKLCPGIQFVKARPNVYVRVHHEIARAIDECALVHKAYSIDEWAIRLRGGECEGGAAEELAGRIKASIRGRYSVVLSCSIGIAPTRLLAKIACDLQKPDGLTILRIADLPGRLEHLKLQDLCGIGAGMAARLDRHEIRTVGDLWGLDRRKSIGVWGSVVGAQWWAGFHGHDEPEVATRRHSMSHESVLEPRFRNEAGARGILTRLVCRLGGRLRDDGYVAGALSISLSDADDRHFSTSIELPQVQDTPTLLSGLYRLWDQPRPTSARPIKVGAVVSSLVPAAQVAGHLFERAEASERLSRAMDTINGRWGASSIYVGSMHGFRHEMDDKIAFGRIPPTCKG